MRQTISRLPLIRFWLCSGSLAIIDFLISYGSSGSTIFHSKEDLYFLSAILIFLLLDFNKCDIFYFMERQSLYAIKSLNIVGCLYEENFFMKGERFQIPITPKDDPNCFILWWLLLNHWYIIIEIEWGMPICTICAIDIHMYP